MPRRMLSMTKRVTMDYPDLEMCATRDIPVSCTNHGKSPIPNAMLREESPDALS